MPVLPLGSLSLSDTHGKLGIWLAIGDEMAGISHGLRPLASNSSSMQSPTDTHSSKHSVYMVTTGGSLKAGGGGTVEMKRLTSSSDKYTDLQKIWESRYLLPTCHQSTIWPMDPHTGSISQLQISSHPFPLTPLSQTPSPISQIFRAACNPIPAQPHQNLSPSSIAPM